jgi:Fe-S cluster assembly protein SufD
MDKLVAGGLPGKKSEAYKYTDLSKALARFENSPVLSGLDLKTGIPDVTLDNEFNILVFINGNFSEKRSSVISSATELEILPLTTALKDDQSSATCYFGKIAGRDEDAFVDLNTAFATGGVQIRIPRNARPAPVIMRHVIDTTDGTGISYSRNLVVAETSSESVFLEQFVNSNGHEHFLNSLMEVQVSENAKVQWHKMQNDPFASQIDQTAIYQANSSRFDLTTLTTEGQVIRNNVRIAVDGEGCETHLFGLYLVNGKTHVDNQTSVDHIKPNSVSNELYKGILDDQSHGVFNGKVYVRKEAQKTNAFQSNKNILLTDEATINTKPQLEIWADDVKCSHGCTTGQIDEEALFYLRSRGLSETSARRLMLLAFAIDTMHGIEHEKIKELFEQQISYKLDS